MQICRVVGTLVATQKHRKFEGAKLMLVQPLNIDATPRGNALLAVDGVGAGLGEVILYATGSSARLTAATKDRPVDAVIMGIVDSFDVEGRSVRLA